MPIWLLIAIFATIGITALLAGVLWRLNPGGEVRGRNDTGSAGGDVPVILPADGNSDADGGDSGGGGDGGGGDGGGD